MRTEKKKLSWSNEPGSKEACMFRWLHQWWTLYFSLYPQIDPLSRKLSGVSPLSLTQWGTVPCLTCLCVGVPELCQVRLNARRYWREFHCRSALKVTPCVKISDAKKHEEIDGKLLLWSPRWEETATCQTWLSFAVFTAAAAAKTVWASGRELILQ